MTMDNLQEDKKNHNHNYKRSEEVITSSSVSGVDIATGHYEYIDQHGSRVCKFYAREIYSFFKTC